MSVRRTIAMRVALNAVRGAGTGAGRKFGTTARVCVDAHSTITLKFPATADARHSRTSTGSKRAGTRPQAVVS
jgi:hypothetical protein